MLAGAVPWPSKHSETYRRSGLWRGEPLGEMLRAVAGGSGNKTAIVFGNKRLSYAALDAWADALAGGLLRHGISGGQRVIVQLPNIPEFVAMCIAAFRAGAIPVLTLPSHRRSELAYLAELTEAVAMVIPAIHQRFDHRVLAREVRAAAPTVRHVIVAGPPEEFESVEELAVPPMALPDVDPAEVALMLLSGGTTGMPKLIPRTHDDYALQLRESARAMRFGADDCYLAALPAAHNAALGCPGVLGALAAGGKVVLASSPSPDEVFPVIEAERVRLTTLMPSFLPVWLEAAPFFNADLSALTIEVGGARLAPELAGRVEPELGCTLSRWFGMAEGLLCCTRRDDDRDARVITEGRPLSSWDEIRVVDADGHFAAAGEVGEMLVRGPYTIRGYYRAETYNAEVFTSDGFLRTGDLVRLDGTGRLTVEGRVKEVINRGGEKVSPGEVEEHLLAHPRISEAAIVPFPDTVLGEKTCAVIVLSAGTSMSLRELRTFLTGCGLADYKLPDKIRLAAQLPRTSLGKLDRRFLMS
jgi:2,3-dihydroxybenzoate-AMP ligase